MIAFGCNAAGLIHADQVSEAPSVQASEVDAGIVTGILPPRRRPEPMSEPVVVDRVLANRCPGPTNRGPVRRFSAK